MWTTFECGGGNLRLIRSRVILRDAYDRKCHSFCINTWTCIVLATRICTRCCPPTYLYIFPHYSIDKSRYFHLPQESNAVDEKGGLRTERKSVSAKTCQNYVIPGFVTSRNQTSHLFRLLRSLFRPDFLHKMDIASRNMRMGQAWHVFNDWKSVKNGKVIFCFLIEEALGRWTFFFPDFKVNVLKNVPKH